MIKRQHSKGHIVIPQIYKKRLDRASIIWKVRPKNFDGGHLPRTQKAAGPSVESKAKHSAWIIKCHLTDFQLSDRMFLIYLYLIEYTLPRVRCCSSSGSYQYGADLASKSWIQKQ